MGEYIKRLKKYRKYLIGVFLLTFFDVMTELYLPNLMGKIVDEGIISGDTAFIISTGIRMLLVAFLATFSMLLSAYLSSKVGMGFSRDLREEVFTHVEKFSLGEFGEMGTSSLIIRTTNDINQLQQLVMMSMRMMLRAPFMLVGGIIMAISKNKELSLLLLVAMPILVVAIAIVGKKGFPLFKKAQKKVDKLNLVLREKLTGVRVIRAFDRSEYEEERFEEASRELTDTTLKVNRLMVILFPLVNLVLNFTIIGIIWFGAKQVDMGNMFIGDIMAFIQYVMLTMMSLIMFSAIFVVVPRAAASAERINQVLDMKPSIVDKEVTREIDRVETLEFRDVDFSYPNAEKNALCDINFKVKKGETLAIIGGTGSGKSALINLIPRFFDVSKGSIKINGIDIRDISQENLRDRIGYVPQTAVLFTGSVKDNIRQGNPEASDEEVVKAAKIAQAEDFIMEMDDKYDSIISQGGTNISGGQKQRLSIARALVKQGDIYIFDDSFSALDFKTDARLRQELAREVTDAIVIIVAQRVSTVKNADKILVLDDGRLVGSGSHKELLEGSEVYREIVKSQVGEAEI